MAETSDKHRRAKSKRPSDSTSNKTVIDISTFHNISEHFLSGHPTRVDIESGDLDLTFEEALQEMADSLASHFQALGRVHATTETLPGEIRNAAVKIQKDAFGATVGKRRGHLIHVGLRETVQRIAAGREPVHQKGLADALAYTLNQQNFPKIGAGNRYTISSAIRQWTKLVLIHADRGGPPRMPPDMAARIEAHRLAESASSINELNAVLAASAPAEIGILADGLLEGSVSVLEQLLQWTEHPEPGSEPANGALRLAKQCASLNWLNKDQMRLLSEDVARRMHHPFGLMTIRGQAHMVEALYLYAGEAPYEAMKQAWAYLMQSDALHHMSIGHISRVLDATFAALTRAMKNQPVRWMNRLSARPSAVDILRLIAALAATSNQQTMTGDKWQEGLLEEFLHRYGSSLNPSAAAELLAEAFDLSDPRTPRWWAPDNEWNTVGCRLLGEIATFDYDMPPEDVEDLRVRARETLIPKRLSELRDNLVRSESHFPQTLYEKKDGKPQERSKFLSDSPQATNGWLWKLGYRQTKTFLTSVKTDREDTHWRIRTSSPEKRTVRTEIHARGGRSSDVPATWFDLSVSPEVKNRLTSFSHSSVSPHPDLSPAEARTAALKLLELLTRPNPKPRAGQHLADWISERVDEINSLESFDQSIHPSQEQALTVLLEATLLHVKEQDNPK